MSTITIDDLMNKVETYIHKEKDLNKIKEAYELAFKKHNGQFRRSGEPYISHPLNVAYILAELTVGPDTIMAGLLHDVLEDTDTTYDEIKSEFGEDVANLVDGVTKVAKLTFSSLEQKQVENHQKMLVAIAKDIRVVVVKLADRLHNIRTIDFQVEEKRKRICEETLEIYAPLADKLGMFKIKAELEDRSLKYVAPKMYEQITKQIEEDSSARLETIDKMIIEIKAFLKPFNITDITIKGRIKNLYSIYKKMITQNKSFDEIYDVLAIRIIVDSVAQCYQVLGVIHSHYVPVPKRFKDYIAVPKSNMYQSLHTTVIGGDGQTFEVQIRTKEMDQIAEYGVAAHWAYKENVEYSKEKEQYEIAQKLKWYGDLLKFSEEDNENNNPSEFVDTVKEDLLNANVYVYTPTGEVIDLQKGATPLDYAYKIHTNIGNKTVGAKVNNRIVPLDYELHTGDIVSILTSNTAAPNLDWLNIVRTNHAKHKIRNYLNKQNKDVLISQGKSSLDNELTINKIIFNLSDEFVSKNFSKTNISTVEDLYAEIGKGNISPKTVIQRINSLTTSASEEMLQKQMEKSNRILTTNSETGVIVEGLKKPKLRLGSCCSPIPGDPIVGFVSKENGLVVHHKNCKNLQSLSTNRILDLYWAINITRSYPVKLKITASQSITLITEIMNTVNSQSMSIASISANNNSNLETVIKLKVLVKDLDALERLVTNLKKINKVHDVEREGI